jgi:hypothetical protein
LTKKTNCTSSSDKLGDSFYSIDKNSSDYINDLANLILKEDNFIRKMRKQIDKNILSGIKHVSIEFLTTQAEGFFKHKTTAYK